MFDFSFLMFRMKTTNDLNLNASLLSSYPDSFVLCVFHWLTTVAVLILHYFFSFVLCKGGKIKLLESQTKNKKQADWKPSVSPLSFLCKLPERPCEAVPMLFGASYQLPSPPWLFSGAPILCPLRQRCPALGLCKTNSCSSPVSSLGPAKLSFPHFEMIYYGLVHHTVDHTPPLVFTTQTLLHLDIGHLVNIQ